jgi:hypothetical protein
LVAAGSASGTTTLSSPPTTAPLSAAQLATEYLRALGPANNSITKAEKELRALSITASPASVEAIVVPLRARLAPLEDLLNGVPTSSGPPPPPAHPVSLASLGQPTIVEQEGAKASPNPGWGTRSYSTVNTETIVKTSPDPPMTMAGKQYSGVQVDSDNEVPSLQELTWRFGTARTFTADIGLDSSSSSASVVLGFVTVQGQLADPTGFTEVPFSADGSLVTATSPNVPSIPVESGVPTPVSVNVSGIHQLSIILEETSGNGNPTIDIANGEFS